MDFTFTEEQETIAKVARRLFDDRTAPQRLAEIEARGERHDAALWKDLAGVDLRGVGLPSAVGGSGHGFLEVAVILSEVGWSVAPVPAYAALVLGADPIARYGTAAQQARYLPGIVAGSSVLSAGWMEPGRTNPSAPATAARRDGECWRIDGTKELVPAAQLADAVVVPATTEDGDVGLFVVETAGPGVEVTAASTTNGEPLADVVLEGAAVRFDQRLGEPGRGAEMIESLYARALVGLCAIQLGVAERALRIAAAYTSEREQFGRPIGSFQAVQQRMADAFIDVEAIRWTTWHAAWLLAHERPASRAASIAKFWAAEAGARVVATAQQVHGGIGLDTTYPLHRYFLWAKQNELALGSASYHLARLGMAYTEENR